MFLKDPTYISSFFSISLNEVHYDLKKFVMISGFPISCSHSIHTSGWVSSVISSSLEILPHELSLFIHFSSNLPGIYFGRGNHCCTLRHYRYQRIPHLGRQRDPICLTVVCMLSTNMLLQKTKETWAKTNENRANVHARQQAHRKNTGCR